MILLPALVGGSFAAATAALLVRQGLMRPGPLGLIVVIIAAFWPAFALTTPDHLPLHLTVFAAFAATALVSRRIGLTGLGLALLAHGLLDGVLFFTHHPGPLWWPAFCAAYDVVLGAALLTPRLTDPTP